MLCFATIALLLLRFDAPWYQWLGALVAAGLDWFYVTSWLERQDRHRAELTDSLRNELREIRQSLAEARAEISEIDSKIE